MAEYGYAYRSVSTYSTKRNGTREPAVIKPFVPFIPKSDGSNYSESAVTRKKIVPVTSRPYDEPTTEKYASSGDESDYERYHQTSPVRSSQRKVDDKFPTKVQQNPQRFGPQSTGIGPIMNGNYNGRNTYDGDHRPTVVGDPNPPYKEGRKPIGGGRTRSTDGGGGDKDGRKPIGISPIRNDTNTRRGAPVRSSHHDRYGDKEEVKPIGINGYGIGSDHRVTDSNPYKEGRKPIGPHDGYNPFKEGRKPIGVDSTHDGYNINGYGGEREGRKPIINNKNENGYGNDYNKPTRNSNREDKPFGSSKYDDGDNYSNNVPKIISNWTAAPRKGTQLSQPIHDIDKAMELLRMEAAKRDHYYDSPTLTDRTGSGATMTPYGNVNRLQPRPRDSTTRVTFVDDVSDDYYWRDDIGRYDAVVIDSREAEKKFRGTRV